MAEDVVAEFTIVVRREVDTLPDIAHQLTVLDSTWVVATAFTSYQQGLTAWMEKADRGYTPRPYGIRLTKQSPMVLDIAVNDILPWGLTSGVAGLFVYFIRNPDKLGSFFHEVVGAWHNAAADSEEAKRGAWVQRQINKELLGGAPPDPDMSDMVRTSHIVRRLGDDLASLNAEVIERNESE
ncbi:hypothetical protein EXE59_02970 [Nocardioides eburneiflavus]|uniref:Uncharacterized protein n=1 Tax=Nocardioides eburneiflavus TaxID=2518372 RepID=A0A4Z1CM08_9ACTN|nr:hypothetical protein [Nocardioides eburneiflavus]TGN63019.1 hypothetical protein EXE59_02970 [Nocardioides eburneiflavus]